MVTVILWIGRRHLSVGHYVVCRSLSVSDLVDVDFRDGTRLGCLDDLRQRRDEAFENRLLMLLALGSVLVQEDGQVLFEVDRRRVEPQQEKAREQTT